MKVVAYRKATSGLQREHFLEAKPNATSILM
jgi:hypothetical protein